MQIVIDIDKESYEHIKSYKNEDVLPMGWYAISHGTPLTKVDWISRQAAIDLLKNMNTIVSPISDDVLLIDKAEAMTKLTFLPSVQLESDATDINVGNKNSMLDKIRTEIKALSPEPTVYDVVDGNPIKDAVWETLADVLKIIDKYKTESEVKYGRYRVGD